MRRLTTPLLLLISSVLLAASHAGLVFLAWIGFVPAFFALGSISSVKRRFVWGILFSFLYFLLTFRWFLSLHPLTVLDIQGISSLILALIVTGLSSLAMALPWGAAFVFRKPSLSLAPLLVLATYAQSWLFGLLWMGNGSLSGPHWTLGNPAYALHGSDLLRLLSSFSGIYGILFILLSANLVLYLLLVRGERRRAALIFALLFAVLWIPLPAEEGGIPVSLIQTRIPSDFDWDPRQHRLAFEEQLRLLAEIGKDRPETQVTVLPEGTDFFRDLSTFLSTAQVQTYFRNLFPDGRLILSGSKVLEKDEALSRTFALDTREGIQGHSDKTLLMPGSEYVPYVFSWILPEELTASFRRKRELSPGKESALLEWQNYRIAPAVCSEFLSPSLVRSRAREADLLVSTVSLGFFRGDPALMEQNLAAARFRAAENRRPLAAAVNYGRSFILDSRGEIRALATTDEPQVVAGSILPSSKESWYAKYGDVPVLLLMVLLGGVVFRREEEADR